MAPEGSFDDALAAARQGEPRGFDALWRRYAPAVVAYARARGSREPEDLTSEVFLAVFRNLAGFAGDEGAFRGYVFTIARRRLVDELRRRARHGVDLSWSEETDTRTTLSAEASVLDAAASAEVRALLEGLAPDQRDVLVLRIIGDLTIDQIAAVVGKRPGAVKALQRRGLAAVRRSVAGTRTAVGVGNDGRG